MVDLFSLCFALEKVFCAFLPVHTLHILDAWMFDITDSINLDEIANRWAKT
jgi:hypothetical protein